MAKSKATKEEVPAEGAEPKKKSKKKLVLVFLVVVVLGVGGFGYMKMSKKPPVAVKGAPTTTAGGPITEEASLTVNLRDNHYLEFTAGIQTVPGQSDAVLTTDQPIVLDILNTQAESMTQTQLLMPNGPAKLKAGMVQALNQEWPGLVQAVYFEQFVMQ
jgi:flagellar basal body-associated protein FliL